MIVWASFGTILTTGLKLSVEIDSGNIIIRISDRGDRYLSTTVFDD